ncbi:MAG: hypothetical protein KKA60_07960 [Proteobacteria bacterium]|nr:hypothetical protein [Pseudomonadota bacterium]
MKEKLNEQVESLMAKSRKGMSFDGMVKFFLQYYRIPTRKDIERLMDRIDQMEKLIKVKWTDSTRLRSLRGGGPGDPEAGRTMTASDVVEEVIRSQGSEGASFTTIRDQTGFDDKKLRNIIFRLNKLGRISRKARGVYTT